MKKKETNYGKLIIGIFLIVLIMPMASAQIDVSRSMPDSATQGDVFTVTLTVDVDENNPPGRYKINETAPDGWTISNVTIQSTPLFDPLITEGHILTLVFSNDTTNITDQNITYQVTVPVNAVPRSYTFNGSVRIKGTTINITGNNTITILSPPPPQFPVSVSRHLPRYLPVSTTSFTVNLTVNVDENNPPGRYKINETAPDGWTISNVTTQSNYSVKAIKNNVLVLVFSNETSNITDQNITYQVTVPANTSNGTYLFNGVVKIPGANESIGGDQNITIVGDITPPTSTITSPANGSYIRREACIITGNATDDISGVKWVNVSISTYNETIWYTADGTDNWIFNCSFLEDGKYFVNSRATDNADNVENETLKDGIKIIIDNTPPELNVTSPVSGRVWVLKTTPNVDVAGRVFDMNMNLESLIIKVDGVVQANITNPPTEEVLFNQTVNLLTIGNHTIEVNATDKAGNTAGVDIRIELCAKGDYECDGDVDTTDFMRFAVAYGVTPAASWADFNDDGVVDNIDFFAFADAWTG